MAERQAYVTLVTNENYGTGALVLGHSLKETNTERKKVVLITQNLSLVTKQRLLEVWDELVEVEAIDSQDDIRLAILQRPELGVTFTKIQIWRLTQFEKVVFLDADTLVLKNVDELFERPELSAAPDVGWPDCFNSGVFVCVPSSDTYKRLEEFIKTSGSSFDGGDQGLLNNFFPGWAESSTRRLSFLYNVVSHSFYSYLPAFLKYKDDIKIVHFIGERKPWYHRPGPGADINDLAHKWWAVYDRHINWGPGQSPAAISLENLRISSFGTGGFTQPSSSSGDFHGRFNEKLAGYRVSWEEAVVPMPAAYMDRLEGRMENLEQNIATMSTTLQAVEQLLEKDQREATSTSSSSSTTKPKK